MVDEVRFHFDNLAKHEVAPFEAEEALYDGWKKRRRTGLSQNGHDQYEVLGKTQEGRHLHLACEHFQEIDQATGETQTVLRVIRVFHGREMNPTERRRYGQK